MKYMKMGDGVQLKPVEFKDKGMDEVLMDALKEISVADLLDSMIRVTRKKKMEDVAEELELVKDII